MRERGRCIGKLNRVDGVDLLTSDNEGFNMRLRYRIKWIIIIFITVLLTVIYHVILSTDRVMNIQTLVSRTSGIIDSHNSDFVLQQSNKFSQRDHEFIVRDPSMHRNHGLIGRDTPIHLDHKFTLGDASVKWRHKFNTRNTSTIQDAFLINTQNCKIPNLNPFDESLKIFLKKGKRIVCDRYPQITYTVKNKLHINWTAVDDSFLQGKLKFCTYNAIYRPYEASDNKYFSILEESQEFNTTQIIAYDFIRVQCFNNAYGKLYTNFHQFIHRQNKTEERCKQAYEKHKEINKNVENLNVILLGVDSVSRLNFHRYFRKTRSFIINKLNAFEMNGYNKIADNTFVNIVPITTGKFVEELPWNETMRKSPFDNFTFIWNKFSERGYRTLYAEDAPKLSIFDFAKSGFKKQPTDYFNRHLSLAMERYPHLWYNGHHCITNKLETEFILEYVHQFASEFKNDPHFAFTFITRLTHNVLENSAAADEPYYNFFKSLREKKLINNSIIFFFSDHGLRYGDFRNTYSGKLEERLPFMYIILPKWFLGKYPTLVANLKINSFRLSTPFDIHATLMQVLNFKVIFSKEKQRSLSLFGNIPDSRSCDDAGILPQWCTCTQEEQLDPKNNIVLLLAKNLMSQINKYIDQFQVCEKLYLKEIEKAVKLLSSNKILTFVESKNDVINRKVTFGNRTLSIVDYQLTIKTKPGDGLFEATIRYDELGRLYQIVGEISRINRYGDQGSCIDQHHLQRFCYCK